MNCPDCNKPMTIVGSHWVCGEHDPPVTLAAGDSAETLETVGHEFAALPIDDLKRLPYPIETVWTGGR